MKQILTDKVKNLPQEPGVYFFYGAAESAYGGRSKKASILYIGKATSLKSRVSSYFRGEHNRGQWITRMVSQVTDIDFLQTDSVLEALILEANLIKKYLPKYNTLGKDDKSAAYFAITKEEFPKVLILRKTDLETQSPKPIAHSLKPKSHNPSPETQNPKPKTQSLNSGLRLQDTGYRLQVMGYGKIYGPYASKHQMQIALKIIRRIFPFHSNKQKTEKGCLDFQLGFCPGPYAGAISKDDYQKNIRGIRMILEGKKKSLVTALEKEMKAVAKKNEFEKAAQLRNRIFALQHIRDVALISKDFERNTLEARSYKLKAIRIEAYDISNISGTNAVGSMVVFTNGQPDKSQYRKFKIKTVDGSDDVGMMREVLLRRFKNDWTMPDFILLDGGVGHFNMAEKLLHEELGLAVVIAAVAKGLERKNLDVRYDANLPASTRGNDSSTRGGRINANPRIANILEDKNLLKHVMDEAHRFAIAYHRKLRKRNSLE